MNEHFRVGDRIRLVSMVDDPDPIEVGTFGTVTAIRPQRDWLQIEVDWDNGRKLMLSVPPDRVEIVGQSHHILALIAGNLASIRRAR